MPKKRATKAASSRAKPNMNMDKDEMVNGMTKEEREVKLANFVKDFDVTGARYTDIYDQELKVLESMADKKFQQIRIRLAMRERKLTVTEYIAELENEEEEDSFDEGRQTILAKPLSTIPAMNNFKDTISKYRSRRVIEPILEEGGGQSTVQRPKRGGKVQGVTFNANPTPSLSNSKFITPAMQRKASTLGWNTPLVTPKFDPRLPVTPAQKRPVHPGEVVMSLAGSPISVEDTDRLTGRGQTMQILDNLEIPDNIENWTGNHLQEVMNVFANIVKKGQAADQEDAT